MIVTDGTIMRDPPIPNTSAAGWRYGTADNNLTVSLGGVISLAGTAKRTLRQRPDLDYINITAQGKPTLVRVGSFAGFSLPIYNNDDEELFLKGTVPRRWDEISDPKIVITCVLASAEDVGDKFQLRASWARKAVTSGVISTDTTDSDITQVVAADRNAQYSIYELVHTVDWDLLDPDIEINDLFSVRIRRIAAAAPQITGEVIVLGVEYQFTVDKMFGA
jgi:hypothetical protein